ncbi:metal ion efflux RND protein family protein, partial [mine drainage metagenome]
MVSGVKAQVAIRVYGDDLMALAAYGNRISQEISGVRGVHDVTVQRIMGQPNIIIRVKRDALFRAGLSVSDILGIVQQGIGPDGVMTQVLKGVRRINVHI